MEALYVFGGMFLFAGVVFGVIYLQEYFYRMKKRNGFVEPTKIVKP